MNMPLWFSNLAFWSAQTAVLVVPAAFLPNLLQIRQPRVLLVYWRALIATSLLLPFIQPWHRPMTNVETSLAREFSEAHAIPDSSSAVARWHLPSGEIIAQLIGGVILAGIMVRFVMLVLGLLKLREFRRTSSPIPATSEAGSLLNEMRTRVNARGEFRITAGIDSPVTFGFASPVILLPKRFPGMDARFQAAIACHELLHVRRNDWTQHVAEEIVRGLFWFHPAIGWLIARVRLAREQVVDLEVVKLTDSRKLYVEALLEFTTGGGRIAAIPAPPFLVERQLAERVAQMLKEVRMSRTRLIASLTAVGCGLGLVAGLAVWTFPLKAAPRAAQNAPQGGIAQGVSGGVSGGKSGGAGEGVSGGVSEGVGNGVSGGVATGVGGEIAQGVSGGVSDMPVVDSSTIWMDIVKKGPMQQQVRGLGTLVQSADSKNLVARIVLPEYMTVEVKLNQDAAVDTRKGIVKGHVSQISSVVSSGMREVDIALDSTLPEGAGAGLQVDGTIDIHRFEDILTVGRPVHAEANSALSLFKIVDDGKEAVRVKVKFGHISVNTIEVAEGLDAGDKIILSDMSQYDKADRIRIK